MHQIVIQRFKNDKNFHTTDSVTAHVNILSNFFIPFVLDTIKILGIIKTWMF